MTTHKPYLPGERRAALAGLLAWWRRADRTTLAAAAIWAATLALAAIALVLRTVNQELIWEPMPGAQQLATLLYWMILMPAGVPAYATVGALLAARRPRLKIGWLCLLIALIVVAEDLCWLYAFTALRVAPGSLPGGQYVVWVGGAIYSLMPIAFTLLLLIFPNGALPSPRWRPAVALALVGGGAQALGMLLLPTLSLGPPVIIANPVVAGLPAGTVELVINAGGWMSAFALLLAIVSVFVRWRGARGDQRLQLGWLVYAGALMLIFGLGGIVGTFLSNGEAYAATLSGAVGIGALTIGVPVAIGVAVLRYRLYDIDLLVNRTLVYAALTACVVGIYVLVVGGLGALLQSQASLAVSLAATGLVAVLFQPLRARLQRGVNRLLYGERDEPYAVLARLGQRLEASLAPDAVLPTIVETIAQALRLPYVALLLAGEDEPPRPPATGQPSLGFATVAAVGSPPAGGLIDLPLVYQNEPVGRLLLAPRRADEPLSPADRRLLHDLARQAGVAVHAVRLTADLRRSRERLVSAREEERRRLRRDLHDGLGPELASHTLKLEAACELASTNPERAAALLGELIQQSQAMIGEIRRLVYGLRPPTLDELGLVAAIREQATHCGQRGLHIAVQAPAHLPGLPAAVEVAAYRIAQEALTNVVKHAQAHSCVVALDLLGEGQHRTLALEVSDDGVGLPDARRAGVGLGSMRERAEELGGVCQIVAGRGGGTRVSVFLPAPDDC